MPFLVLLIVSSVVDFLYSGVVVVKLIIYLSIYLSIFLFIDGKFEVMFPTCQIRRSILN